MPIFYQKNGRSVLYIHVPKTGGTHVEHLFKENGYDIHLWATKPKKLGLVCAPQHFHHEIYRHFLSVEAYKLAFLTVRNPVDRLLSSYRNSLRRKVIDISLLQWLEDVARAIVDEPFVNDNHLRPQHEFSHPRLHVFKQEEQFGPVWAEELSRRFDLGFRIFDVESRRPINKHQEHLSDAEKNAVVEFCLRIYSDDFKTFGYFPEDAKAIRGGN